MTRDEIIRHLENWMMIRDRLDQAWGRLEQGLGTDMAGTPLFEAIWAGFETYTKTLGQLLGDTNSEWLNWFWLENDMGGKGHDAGYDGNLVPIKTLGDLADLIIEERNHA